MILLVIFTGIIYILLIGLFYIGWYRLPFFSPSKNYKPIKVSVIIPFRNEELNLPILINNIKNQDYPLNLIEIIAINDHSSDKSYEIAQKLNIDILLNTPDNRHGKKAALLKGTEHASGELIVTTDADCTPLSTWISTLVSYYLAQKPLMMVSPVAFQKGGTLFSKFQELEFLSLQGSTAGSIAFNHPIMCNGANLAFSSKILPEIRLTYNTIKHASGDDIFALLAINKNYPGQIHFIKSPLALVNTKSESSLSKFFQQRMRWASKAKLYTNPFLITTSSIILITNTLLFFLLIQSIIFGTWKLFFVLILFKSLIDLPFLASITSFYNAKKLLVWFPVFQSFYFLYITLTFVMSLFIGYAWKSRKIST